MTPDGASTGFGSLPADSPVFPLSHPAKTGALARLFALQSPDPSCCRVLEIACGSGGNLLPMAALYPEASLVGIDASPLRVEEGLERIFSLGLRNVELRCGPLNQVDESWGTFDYIIAHGVYSWVDEPTQERLLEIASRNLSPAGIAYVGYNTYPGWGMRGMLREMIRYHAAPFSEPAQKVAQARALVAFLAESVPAENNPWGLFLRQEHGLLSGISDSLLGWEHLQAENRPCFFSEFAGRAAQHGLSYLGEADFSAMVIGNFPPRIAEALGRIGPDLTRQEQYMDFLRNRAFRQSLLVHAQSPIDRNIGADRLSGLFIASPCSPGIQGPEGSLEFRHPNGLSFVTRHEPSLEAFRSLAEAFPSFLPVEPLLRDPAVGADLLRVLASGMAELRTDSPPLLLELPEHPCVWWPARLAAERSPTPGRGAAVPTLRHETVRLDELSRRVAILADGSRSRAQIEEELVRLVAAGELAVWDRDRKVGEPQAQRHYIGVGLAQSLEMIRRGGLLCAPPGPGG